MELKSRCTWLLVATAGIVAVALLAALAGTRAGRELSAEPAAPSVNAPIVSSTPAPLNRSRAVDQFDWGAHDSESDQRPATPDVPLGGDS